VMGNHTRCDARHIGVAISDIKADYQRLSDLITANIRFLLIFSLGWMLRLAT